MRPLTAQAISILPIADRVGSRLNFWKTKLMRCLRSRVRSASLSVAKSMPSMTTRPLRGPRQAAQKIEQRGLARARGTHDGHKLAALDGQRHAAHRRDLKSARRINLDQIFGENNRRGRFGGHNCTL